MEKLKQKVAALQENIEKSKLESEKVTTEVLSKEQKIEELLEKIEDLNSKIHTTETDLETSEEELSGLKNERKKMTDDEEDQDRNLRKLQMSTNQSKAGASGLQEKIKSYNTKLASLQSEIYEKENNIEMLEQDLDMAEQNNNTYKEELTQLEAELVEATHVLQSIASSHVTTSGAGGNLRNQVGHRNESLKKRKEEHQDMSAQVDKLLADRDGIESDIEEANTRLEEIKVETAQLFEELETL